MAASLKACVVARTEVLFFPSRPGYTDPGVSRRVLDHLLFMNSKVLFTLVRCLVCVLCANSAAQS